MSAHHTQKVLKPSVLRSVILSWRVVSRRAGSRTTTKTESTSLQRRGCPSIIFTADIILRWVNICGLAGSMLIYYNWLQVAIGYFRLLLNTSGSYWLLHDGVGYIRLLLVAPACYWWPQVTIGDLGLRSLTPGRSWLPECLRWEPWSSAWTWRGPPRQ